MNCRGTFSLRYPSFYTIKHQNKLKALPPCEVAMHVHSNWIPCTGLETCIAHLILLVDKGQICDAYTGKIRQNVAYSTG